MPDDGSRTEPRSQESGLTEKKGVRVIEASRAQEGDTCLPSRLARGRRRMIRELLAATRATQEPDDDRVTRASLGLFRVVGSRVELKKALMCQVGTRSRCHFCRTQTFTRRRVQKKYVSLHCRTCDRLKSRTMITPPVVDQQQRLREPCEPCGRRTARTPDGKCVNADKHPKPRWCRSCGQRTRHDPQTLQCLHVGHEPAT